MINNRVSYSFIEDGMLDGFNSVGNSDAKNALIGAGIGLAGNIGEAVINNGQDANNTKYGSDGQLIGSMGSAIGTMVGGPIVGAAVESGVRLLNAAGNAMTQEDNYGSTEDGLVGDLGNVIGSITDPLGNITENMDLVDKGYMSGAEAVLASIPGTGGLFGGKARDKYAADRRKEGAKRKKEMEAQKERLTNIQNSKKDYQDLMSHANMYSGSYVARNGGTINIPHFRSGSIVARQGGFQKRKETPINQTLKFKKGGKLKIGITFKKPILNKSIIMNGALHSEFNNIGKGDRGLPIVMADGGKIYEIERDELLLNKSDSNLLILNKNKSNEELGKVFADILFDNTESKSDDYKCLNNNTCTI